MKWIFGKGQGPLSDVGGLGNMGEFYYIPSKRPTLKAPAEALGKERVIPIFPRNQVLGPLGEEYLGVYEMRYRQLLNEIGNGGTFGHVFFSQDNSKLALVGTLARIKKTERLDDGGIYVVMEGIGRFYIRDIISDKPYLKARVQPFNDYCENEPLMQVLEQKVLKEVRLSVKVMKLLYPQNNYTMNEAVLKYRPPLQKEGVRLVTLPGQDTELQRRSKFSFATMDMLKVRAEQHMRCTYTHTCARKYVLSVHACTLTHNIQTCIHIHAYYMHAYIHMCTDKNRHTPTRTHTHTYLPLIHTRILTRIPD